MRILIVTPFPPIPCTSGGATAVYNLIRQLAKRHEVICLTFARREDLHDLQKLAPHCTELITVPYPGGEGGSFFERLSYVTRRGWQNLQSLVTLTPVMALKVRSRAMAAALRTTIDRCHPEVVQLSFPPMAQYIDYCAAQPTVMDTQDVATVSVYRCARAAHNPLVKGYYFVQWLFWLRYEARYYARFAKVLTLTEQDATALRIFTPELDVHVGAVGVEIPSALPKLGAQQQSIGFLANFAHLPNVDAARYFISEILPLIRRELPAVKFLVAGKNPPVELLREAGSGVEFVGYVEDVPSFYAGVEVVVAPLRLGGGIKIKVLEAMACGKPVITTSIGAEGIASQDEGALLICDTPAEMAGEVVRLLREPDQGKRWGEGGGNS